MECVVRFRRAGGAVTRPRPQEARARLMLVSAGVIGKPQIARMSRRIADNLRDHGNDAVNHVGRNEGRLRHVNQRN